MLWRREGQNFDIHLGIWNTEAEVVIRQAHKQQKRMSYNIQEILNC
jgi:hypothetical protein